MSGGFAILIPVLDRPDRAQPLADSIRDNSTLDHLILFIVSARDGASYWAARDTGEEVLIAEWEPGHADFAKKINYAYTITDQEFVFQAADDLEFQDGWDTAALDKIQATGCGVCGTNDGANPKVMRGDHSTHSLIRREYIEHAGASLDGPGTVFSEVYGHQYCDNELVELAKHRAEWTFAHDSHVYHRHPMYARDVFHDDTYAKGQSTAREDHLLWRDRQRRLAIT